jgi:hypothetical protein
MLREWANHTTRFDVKLSFGRQFKHLYVGVFPARLAQISPVKSSRMKTDATLFQRRRPLTAAELDVIPWFKLLSAPER